MLSPYLSIHLAEVPSVVGRNLKKHVYSSLAAGSARTLLYFDPVLTVNLWTRGAFSDINLLGVLTGNSRTGIARVPGLNIYSRGDLECLAPDRVLISDYRYHKEIVKKLSPLAEELGFEIVDLCDGFEETVFRREWSDVMTRHIFSNVIPDWPARQVEIWVPPGCGLGDKICAISAAREFARRHRELRVVFRYVPEIVQAYEDDLVTAGSGGYLVPDQYPNFFTDPNRSLAGNYLGCYYLNLGMNFDIAPCLELPSLSPNPDLKPGSYIALQPQAVWAQPNLAPSQLETIVRMAPLPVVVVGKPETPRNIGTANYEHLGPPLEMLRVIQHAAFVLTPRSASANIAAAYGVPCRLWVPSDGANWQLKYPGWDYKKISVRSTVLSEWIIKEMVSLKEKLDRANQEVTCLNPVVPNEGFLSAGEKCNDVIAYPIGSSR